MGKTHIAIDGPAGAGKSTVAKKIAEQLHITYVDTGAMYRALTLKILNQNISFEDLDTIIEIGKQTVVELDHQSVFLDGEDVTEDIRQPRVSSNVSFVAQIPEIRSRMVDLQRHMAENKSVIMDGRDIGTHVLPDTPYKFYLTASIDERTNRRFMELKRKGFQIDVGQLKKEMLHRDKMDQERQVSPLKPAKDAIIIDTTGKSIKEVVNEIICLIKGE